MKQKNIPEANRLEEQRKLVERLYADLAPMKHSTRGRWWVVDDPRNMEKAKYYLPAIVARSEANMFAKKFKVTDPEIGKLLFDAVVNALRKKEQEIEEQIAQL